MGYDSRRSAPWISSLALLAACREGSETDSGDFIPVVPSPSGTQGCGPSTVAPGTVTPVFASAVIGPLSQIAAAADALATETLYLTGDDGSIHQLDFPAGGGAPTDSVLVAPGVIDAALGLAPGTAQLSGITVFDDLFLVVADHATNTLLSVRRDLPDMVLPLAGLPLPAGGFSDGEGGAIRFHFTAPVALLADVSGEVWVADTENHALRLVVPGGIPAADTVTGTGAPGDSVGLLTNTELDTPGGLATSCPGELLMIESGSGFGGNRLLSLAVGGPSQLFGGFDGTSLVLAGDGTNATTEGVGAAAQLGTPMGLVSTQDGVLFWVDALDGILRRLDLTTGLCDCPLFADCAAAVAAGGSFDGGSFSLAIGDSGALYVLEGDLEALHRIDP